MKVTKLAIMFAAVCCGLSSCMKDELPNRECDIEAAYVNLENPTDVFVNASDATSHVSDDLADSIIVFNNVKGGVYANLKLAPEFKISRGSVMYPKSGTMLDFSNGKVQYYYVISEEAKAKYNIPDAITDAESFSSWIATKAFSKELELDSRTGNVRRYAVLFDKLTPDQSRGIKDLSKYGLTETPGIEYRTIQYNFENYRLDSKGKYYEWSDSIMNDNGEMEERTVPNWATANAGYKIARSSAKPFDYPTVPAIGEGVDGTDGVLLQTCKTGTFAQATKKPLAAGNLFLGKFDATDPLNHPLISTRFGENSVLTYKPVKFCGYYRYIPGPVVTDKDMKPIEHATDDGSLYCIIYLNKDADGNPVVLDGENVDTHPSRAAIAEVKKIVHNTDEYQHFQLDFEWIQPFSEKILAERGYSYAIVCSSSYRGAYFEGAEGSKLYVDKFDIIVEKKK